MKIMQIIKCVLYFPIVLIALTSYSFIQAAFSRPFLFLQNLFFWNFIIHNPLNKQFCKITAGVPDFNNLFLCVFVCDFECDDHSLFHLCYLPFCYLKALLGFITIKKDDNFAVFKLYVILI